MSSTTDTGPLPAIRRDQQPGSDIACAPVDVARAPWEVRYTRAVVGADLLLVSLAALLGGWLGAGGDLATGPTLTGALLAAVAAALTVASLAVCRAWEPRVLGQGCEEFGRVVRAVAYSAGVLGLTGLAAGVDAVRLWTFGVLPMTCVTLLATRYGLRRGLHRRRELGTCLHPVLAVGTPESVAELVVRTNDARHLGWVVTGACTVDGRGFGDDQTVAGVPVVGDLEVLPSLVADRRYRVVAVSPSPGWSPRRLQRLAWDLESSGTELVVDPGLMEVAGPRLHARPVDGLPMLRLTEPSLHGLAQVVKNGLDRLGALVLLLVLLPVFIGVGIAVKGDGGPVFFRQTRVGRAGTVFRMWKFRSMVVDAEQRRLALAAADEGAGPLFKLRYDPRVTRVGHWLRRYSMDELPQLLNVLTGSMSLVGPRPPLPEEVLAYSREEHRRLHVRPGLTGLWQVSGRSDLSWEESIRLDLRYVENWSLALDALILWKTAGAVLKGEGAY